MLCVKKDANYTIMQYFLWELKDLNVSVATSCLHISYVIPPNDLQQPFLFSRGATFDLSRTSFKRLAFLALDNV